MADADIIDLIDVQPGDVPARCWPSLQRIKGFTPFLREIPDDDDKDTA